ncbi:MAG: hypothetical protein ACFB0C_19585 [Leptolyngbyaceae cyanobacterium]
MPEIDDLYKTQPFTEAIDFVESKIALDTDGWRDGAGDIQDAFFTSAGAKGDMLNQIHQAVTEAITLGRRPEEFAAQFEKIAEGWEGNTPWRANLIYFQNLRQAYAVGRAEYQFDPDVLAAFPFLQAVHSGAEEARPIHLWMDQKVWPAESVPLHFPDGFGCGCRYISLGQSDIDAEGLEVQAVAAGDRVEVRLPDGQTLSPVVQPTPGFDYQPGASARGQRRRDLIERVAARSAAPLAEALRTFVEYLLRTEEAGDDG